MARCENKVCVRGVERLSAPFIALFFILVGYEMDLSLLITPTFLTIFVYFVSRAIGKYIGTYTTASSAKMPRKVRINLPYAILTQAGVALGLAAFAYSRFIEISVSATNTAILLLDIIAVSVLIAEIVGPLLLKRALKTAKEIHSEPETNNLKMMS